MRNFVKLMSLVLLAALVGGCVYHGGQKHVKIIAADEKINSSNTFYVPIGPDGKTKTWPLIAKEAPAAASGRMAAELINKSLLLVQNKTIMGTAPESEREALESARQKGLDYVIYSKVNLWVDPVFIACTNSIQRSGAHVYYLDEVEVEISVYDVQSEKVVNLSRLYNSGCPIILLGFIPVGTLTPESRFNKVLKSWVKGNFIPL